MSRFDRTSQQLASLRRGVPLDQDTRDTPVLEVIDLFYISTDPDIIIARNPPAFFLDDFPNYQDVRRIDAFDSPTQEFIQASLDGEPNGGYVEHQVFPILRYNQEGVLEWRFGPTLVNRNILGARELLILETTRVLLKNSASASTPPQALVSMRLSVVGPGGVAALGGAPPEFPAETRNRNAAHHHLVAHALFKEPAEPASPPANRAVLFNVHKATGFWARATNVTVIFFDDPADPNYLAREISILRGVQL